jgi:hypothetical protein
VRANARRFSSGRFRGEVAGLLEGLAPRTSPA